MYWPNLKSVAFPIPEIIGGTRKNWAVSGYAHAPFSLKFLMAFCSVQLVSKISNLCGPDPPTLRTDGRTDGRTDDMQSQYRTLH